MNDEKTIQQFLDSLATVSHEIKTPVNLISATAKIATARIKDHSITSENLMKYLDNIVNNCNKITLMLNNVMSVYSVEFKDYEYINISEFVRDFCDHIDACSPQYGLKLTYNINIEDENVNIPVNIVERILYNLFSNAIKYNSKKDKKIILDVNEKNDMLVFKVCDNGDGISEENIEKVTNKFFRVSNTNTSGIGLGLSLVTKFLNDIGGNFEIKSKINKGTEVVFSIPKSPDISTVILKSDSYKYMPSQANCETELSSITENN